MWGGHTTELAAAAFDLTDARRPSIGSTGAATMGLPSVGTPMRVFEQPWRKPRAPRATRRSLRLRLSEGLRCVRELGRPEPPASVHKYEHRVWGTIEKE